MHSTDSLAPARIPEPPTEPDPVQSDNWEPEKSGDTLVGTVIGRETFHSEKYDRDFVVLTVRDGDGEEKRVPCARAHLGQLVAEHDPQPGDGIAISFFGQRPNRLRIPIRDAPRQAGRRHGRERER